MDRIHLTLTRPGDQARRPDLGQGIGEVSARRLLAELLVLPDDLRCLSIFHGAINPERIYLWPARLRPKLLLPLRVHVDRALSPRTGSEHGRRRDQESTRRSSEPCEDCLGQTGDAAVVSIRT